MWPSSWYFPNTLKFISRPNTPFTAANPPPAPAAAPFAPAAPPAPPAPPPAPPFSPPAPASSTQDIPRLAKYSGIGNGNNSCYMNSAIQFLYSMDPFWQMINRLDLGIIDSLTGCYGIEEKKKVLKAFKSLFDKFKHNTGKTINKKDEYEALLAINKDFRVDEQEDAQEFIQNVIQLIVCFKDNPIIESCYNSIKINSHSVYVCANQTEKRGENNEILNLQIPIDDAAITTLEDGIQKFLETEILKEGENQLEKCGNNEYNNKGKPKKGKVISKRIVLTIPREVTTLVVSLNRFRAERNRNGSFSMKKIKNHIEISPLVTIDKN